MKKKEFAAAAALLTVSSALCLRLMKKVGERLEKKPAQAGEKDKK